LIKSSRALTPVASQRIERGLVELVAQRQCGILPSQLVTQLLAHVLPTVEARFDVTLDGGRGRVFVFCATLAGLDTPEVNGKAAGHRDDGALAGTHAGRGAACAQARRRIENRAAARPP